MSYSGFSGGITICGIVFNGVDSVPPRMLESWVDQALHFGDEVILVEGATKAVSRPFDGDTTTMTRDGRSTDDTERVVCETVMNNPRWMHFKYVPSCGFWDGKTSMCNIWARHCHTRWLWQIDIDEFYRIEDVGKIRDLCNCNEFGVMEFYAHHFWGDYGNAVSPESGKTWGNDIPWRRLFRHEPRSSWQSHEPPVYLDAEGVDWARRGIVSRQDTRKQGIMLHHYGYVSRRQAEFKTKFYRNDTVIRLWEQWQLNHDVPIVNGAHTVPFNGVHPEFARFVNV